MATVAWIRGIDFPAAVRYVEEYLHSGPTGQSHADNGRRRIVATYDYQDPGGRLLYQVVRYDPKDFRQRRPKPGGGWIWNMRGIEPVPYRLPDILAADPSRPVVIVEGEKDVDALAAVGIIATTNHGGAGKWTATHAKHLAGRNVVILPDADEPGERHAQAVALSLQGIAASVRLVRLPTGKDASEWLAAGGTPETLAELIDAAPEWAPAAGPVIGSVVIGTTTPNGMAARIERYWPFPVDALPRPLDAFVDAAAKAMVCDPSYIALPLLAAQAAAIGSTRRVVVKRGWSEPAIIWAAIVGESGTTKTPAFKLVVKPIRELQREALQLHGDDIEQYETALAHYEKDLGRWRREKGNSDPPEKPEQPQAVRYIVSDTTVEALAPLLRANPRGLLLARDELAGWLGSFDRYAAGKAGCDSAHWLSVHNGESLIVDRKTGPTKTIFVPQAYVSVCGGIQPGILHRALGTEHRESGLAARLLLTCPPRRSKRWTDADIDPAAESEFARLLARQYDLQPTTGDDGQPAPVYVGMAADAKRLWVDFYNAHAQEQVELTDVLSAAWSKLESYAARLALIIHHARWAADDDSLQNPDRIDADSMARAVTLVQWFKHEARRVYGMLGESDEQRDTRQLVEWIARKGGAVTARELQQGPRRYRGAQETAEAALEELVKAGIGTWQDVPTTPQGGRPARVFQLGNSGNGYTTPENPRENIGSVAVASVATSETQSDDDDWGEI